MQLHPAEKDRVLRFVLAPLTLVLVLVWVRYQPPAAKPAGTPATEFSAGRAREVLWQLLGDGVPHPVGSAADAVVRERIVGILTQSGYKPEIQTAFACDEWGSCATVKNIVALLDARGSGPSVLLAAHYDSVAAGPGASDDGVGVAAVLEIARVLKALPPPKNQIVILLDEGEEGGLLGAHAFVETHPSAKDVRAAVNIDARGSSGPSLMFETGSANDWLMRLYSRVVTHPVTSSIYYTVYRLLPNDTDFTLFNAAGYQGFNFANIGDVVHYHTSLDNFENADPRTLEHHGENALATLLALANTPLGSPAPAEAVFFDVFARWTVHWPARWTMLVALSALLLLLFEMVQFGRRGLLSLRGYLWGALNWLFILLMTLFLAAALSGILVFGRAFPSRWVAHPLSAEVAFCCVALTAEILTVKMLSRRINFWRTWAGTWTWWTVLALICAWRAPGLSFVFLVPAGLAGLVAMPCTFGRNVSAWRQAAVAIVPAVAAAIVGFSTVWFLYDALGAPFLPGVSAVVAMILTTAAPLIGDAAESRPAMVKTLLLVFGGVTILAAIVALVVPAYTPKSPQRMNIEFVEDAESGTSRWLDYPDSHRLPATLRQAAVFSVQPVKPFPWSYEGTFAADAPHLDLPAPVLDILESSAAGAKRTFRGVLRSPRGAPVITIRFPPSFRVGSVFMDEHALPEILPRVLRWLGGWHAYECLTSPPEGIEVRFTLSSRSPVDLYVLDLSYGLPLEGLFLQKARPDVTVPSQDGDVTIVSRCVRISPDSIPARR